jgi:TatD DNase family protein
VSGKKTMLAVAATRNQAIMASLPSAPRTKAAGDPEPCYNGSVLTDAHIHLRDLLERDPSFPERVALEFRPPLAGAGPAWIGCAASHDESEYFETEALRARLSGLEFVASFGIPPQWPVWKNADLLARLAAERRIAIIGEAGFDFFGDRPDRVRNEENERAQREVFEYQLGLAERHGLPLLLHLRKAMDKAFEYSGRLKRLSGAVFHSYSGTASDAESLLARGIPAWFSFGASVLKGNKRSRAACAAVPAHRLLSETDAPWQSPRRGDLCRLEDIRLVAAEMAAIRSIDPAELEAILERNFRLCYGLPAEAPMEAAP